MNKRQLTAAYATRRGHTMNQARQDVNAILAILTETLATGQEIKLRPFGKFRVYDLPARTVSSPFGDSPAAVPARRVARFKTGEALNTAMQAAREAA